MTDGDAGLPAAVLGDPHEIDRRLVGWLPPSVRSCVRTVAATDDGGRAGDTTFRRYELIGDIPRADLEAARDRLARVLVPAERAMCAKAAGALHLLTTPRREDQDDLTMRIALYADCLSEYPPDVVERACRDWRNHEKFWPSWSELRKGCEELVARRRSLMAAIERRLRAQPKSAVTTTMAAPVWTDNAFRLKAILGEQVWNAWLRTLIPLADDGTVLRLGARTPFIRDLIARQHGAAIGNVVGRTVVIEHFDPVAAASVRRRRKARRMEEGVDG